MFFCNFQKRFSIIIFVFLFSISLFASAGSVDQLTSENSYPVSEEQSSQPQDSSSSVLEEQNSTQPQDSSLSAGSAEQSSSTQPQGGSTSAVSPGQSSSTQPQGGSTSAVIPGQSSSTQPQGGSTSAVIPGQSFFSSSMYSPYVVHLKFLKVGEAKGIFTMLVPEDRMRVEETNNSIIVLCDDSEHSRIDQLLSEIDKPPLQVMFELEAVEINGTDSSYLGIDWGQTTALPTAEDFTGNYFRVKLGNGYGANIAGTLHTLIENKKGKLLASPRIAALNGNTASIMIGDKLAVETTSIASGTSYTTVNYVDVGIKLEVTPFVNDDGTITIHVKPEVSNKTDTTKNGNPNVRTRQAETTLRVKNGQTIVLGGLIQRQDTNDIFKYPILGDLPLVGQLFRTNNREKIDNELVILITPKVISP